MSGLFSGLFLLPEDGSRNTIFNWISKLSLNHQNTTKILLPSNLYYLTLSAIHLSSFFNQLTTCSRLRGTWILQLQRVFSRYISVFQSEEESVDIYHAIFVFCFAFTFFRHSKNSNVTIKPYTTRYKFTLLVVYYRNNCSNSHL